MHLFLVTLNEESGSLASHPTETSCPGVFTDLPDQQVFSDQRRLHGAGWIFPSPSIWELGNLAKVLVFCFVSLSCLDTEAPFLSLLGSASTDASWPPGSVNPIQPALGEFCQGSILLGIAVNPHGSLPLDVYTATLPLLQFPQPGFFHEQSHIRRDLELSTDLEGRQYIRLPGAFPCAHGTAMTTL